MGPFPTASVNRDVAVLVAVACLLATAGCLGLGTDASGSEGSFGGNESAVTVVEVVDGDTVDVRYADGTTDTVRLLGVDTPEVRAENQPAEFEGVPDTTAGRECLREAGGAASDALRDRIAGERVTLVVDPTADRRDRYDRLLAYVERDGTDLNRWLVEAGHARVYDAAFRRSDAYYAAESAAQAEERGVWACRADQTPTDAAAEAPLAVAAVHADAAGDDNENLGDEYVVFRNDGDDRLDLSGWTVRDEAGHTYSVPDGVTLDPGATVTLRTGSGADTETTLYWGRDGAVWNNGGDTVTVLDDEGRVVARESY